MFDDDFNFHVTALLLIGLLALPACATHHAEKPRPDVLDALAYIQEPLFPEQTSPCPDMEYSCAEIAINEYNMIRPSCFGGTEYLPFVGYDYSPDCFCTEISAAPCVQWETKNQSRTCTKRNQTWFDGHPPTATFTINSVSGCKNQTTTATTSCQATR